MMQRRLLNGVRHAARSSERPPLALNVENPLESLGSLRGEEPIPNAPGQALFRRCNAVCVEPIGRS